MLLFLTVIEDEGDRSMLERLYEEYAGLMRNRAYAILKNASDAEDAVQDAFIRMIDHLDKLTDIHGVRTKWYVVTAAENAAIDIYRKKKRISERETVLRRDFARGGAVRYEGRNDIVRIILGLSDRDRSVLILRFIFGYKYAEIGEILKMTEEAVRKVVKRAMERLENECREEGIL